MSVSKAGVKPCLSAAAVVAGAGQPRRQPLSGWPGAAAKKLLKERMKLGTVDFSRAGRRLSYAVSLKGLKEMVAHAG